MQLKPFLLDMWLDAHEHHTEFNLAASTGPSWTLNEVLSLATDEERQLFFNHSLSTATRQAHRVCAPQSPKCKGWM